VITRIRICSRILITYSFGILTGNKLVKVKSRQYYLNFPCPFFHESYQLSYYSLTPAAIEAAPAAVKAAPVAVKSAPAASESAAVAKTCKEK
jgi:hypothetical protein